MTKNKNLLLFLFQYAKLYMKYIISLSQDSIPDYEKYKDIFSKKFNEMGFKNDHVYGWTLERNDYDDDSKSEESDDEFKDKMNQFSSTVRVNCPTNEGSMMHLLKVNQECEKPKFTQPIIKGKRALYTAKNCVSEFDSNRILNKGTDFQPTIRCRVSIVKSKCINKDQIISPNFICVKAMKSKKSIYENEQNNRKDICSTALSNMRSLIK